MMSFFLRFYLLLHLSWALTFADDTTESNPLLTDESCRNNGLWTIWTHVFNSNRTTGNNAEETYSIFYDIAEKTCFPPVIMQIEQNLRIKRSEQSNEDMFFDSMLSYYADTLQDADFRFRYCCSMTDDNDNDYYPTESTETNVVTEDWGDWETDGDFMEEENNSSAIPFTAPDGAICGKQAIEPSYDLSSRIFGGTEAVAHSWPWIINYFQKTNDCGNNVGSCYVSCGGTLISNTFILTAAHCITTENPSDIRIIAGVHQQSSNDEWDKRQSRLVVSIHIHPEFDRNILKNDIALLRVDPPFNYTTYVQPACLANEDPEKDERVIIIGWGAESVDSGMVDILKQAYTTVVGNCWRYWGTWVTNKQICVADPETGDSACKGDSGGPIMTKINEQYVASGVASFTRQCITAGIGTAPNVYTRISSYRQWIDEILHMNK